MDDPVISPECDLRSHIQADFDEKCVGQKLCQFSVLASYKDLPGCKVEDDPHFIISVECRKEHIDLPGDTSVSR